MSSCAEKELPENQNLNERKISEQRAHTFGFKKNKESHVYEPRVDGWKKIPRDPNKHVSVEDILDKRDGDKDIESSNRIAEVERISETEEFNRVFEIGSSIQFKCLIREGTKNQGSDDQVGSYKCPDCTSDQWYVLNTVKRVGPSSLSEKFSNGTSTMDIDDKYFDDPDLDDEDNNYLSGMERLRLSSQHFGQARNLQLKVVKSFWTYILNMLVYMI
ncbi:hypothetical protein Fot_22212 [Forsythia ovata]|uniref:Uncharacterized protein n=1 Tax=Forsythia ovata TaxID=205694 RepID=A0ABD1UXF8_9LAMI